ncbi:MAG: TetR/AcrR family transcriptional regulator [Myxococcales bacterium]|nr:TetR/AcrR family transcriptional regulator [Myxococcales bacterium]MCB9734308.1 TetR/AcrR family transcriptional regulator [Deltaproteobacteria bacterium]
MADEATSNQQRILDAARRLFLSNGYNGSNLRDIARAAKVSMGGIYHHFSSKEEIYRSLLQESDVTQDMLSVLRLLRADVFPQNLSEVGDAIATMVRRHRDTFKLFYIDVLEFEGQHVKPLIQRFWDGFNDVAKLLLKNRDDLAPGLDPNVIMRVIVGVFVHTRLEEAMLELPMTAHVPADDKEITRQMAELLLRGILRR